MFINLEKSLIVEKSNKIKQKMELKTVKKNVIRF